MHALIYIVFIILYPFFRFSTYLTEVLQAYA